MPARGARSLVNRVASKSDSHEMRAPIAHGRAAPAGSVVLNTALDPFLSLKALATYGSMSVRKLRGYLDSPSHPLPHYRVGGKIVVRRSEFDAWITVYRRVGQSDVGGIVESVLRDFRS